MGGSRIPSSALLVTSLMSSMYAIQSRLNGRCTTANSTSGVTISDLCKLPTYSELLQLNC